MKTGFFEEGPEQKSSNRLIFVVGSFWVMALTTYLAIKGGGVGRAAFDVYWDACYPWWH